uniref:Uncharacterized protein n=1 Tax=Micrurus lemniscatus lemniscatus TaxID=129467 RepID=A0A2D4IQK3_MICLE
MDKASEDMFVYFEPLYEVIHDMPRPPESFFKKKSVKSDSETVSLQNSSLDGLAEICPNPPIYEEYKQEGPGLANRAKKSNQVTNDSENEVFCDSLEQEESHQARRLSDKQSFPLSNPPRNQAAEKTGSYPPYNCKWKEAQVRKREMLHSNETIFNGSFGSISSYTSADCPT